MTKHKIWNEQFVKPISLTTEQQDLLNKIDDKDLREFRETMLIQTIRSIRHYQTVDKWNSLHRHEELLELQMEFLKKFIP